MTNATPAQRTVTLYVGGMHCAACTILISDTLQEDPSVTDVDVSLERATVVVRGTFVGEPEVLARLWSARLREHGYALSAVPHVESARRREYGIAFILAGIALVLFLVLDRAGLSSLITTNEVGVVAAFTIGIIASLSTCLAVVGGLVLSLSATYEKAGSGAIPHVLFHAGRIIGFIVLGGALGFVGETLHVGMKTSAFLGLLASALMLFLALYLLGVLSRIPLPHLSEGVFARVRGSASRLGQLAPFALGAATFFLPCGFTQTMQLYALTSGDVMHAASLMVAFALGTLPVLALVSFGSSALGKSKYRGIFFKAAGMLVLIFGMFGISNALQVLGIIR